MNVALRRPFSAADRILRGRSIDLGEQCVVQRRGRSIAGAALLCITLFTPAALAGPAGRRSSGLPALDLAHLSRYRRALAVLNTPGAIRVRRDISNAPRILARARKLARSVGLPLTPSQLKYQPVSPAVNAALDYEQLAHLKRYDPAYVRAAQPLEGWNRLAVYSAGELAAARKELQRRQPQLALIHGALHKPAYYVQRDWRLGEAIPMGPLSALRDAARLLVAECYFDDWIAGRHLDAIRRQADVFRIADQVNQDPLLISFLVAEAIEAIGVRGESDFLYLADRDPAVIEAVYGARERRKGLDLASSLREVTLMGVEQLESLRRAPAAAIAQFIAEQYALPGDQPHTHRVGDFSPEDRRFINRLIDLAEARHLRSMASLIPASRRPWPQRLQTFRSVDRRLDEDRPESIFGEDERVGALALMAENLGRELGRIRTAQAGAMVLKYRAQHGQFPRRLQDAITDPPEDPFSGKPLAYRREANGFVIWSVGPQGTFTGDAAGGRGLSVFFAYPAPAWMREKR